MVYIALAVARQGGRNARIRWQLKAAPKDLPISRTLIDAAETKKISFLLWPEVKRIDSLP